MMGLRSTVEKLIRRLKHDPAYQVDAAISTVELLEILMGRGITALRGLWVRRRLGGARGLLFVGHDVRLQHSRHIHTGRNVTLEDGVRIDALSRSGVRLGDNVSIGRYTVIETSGVLTKLGIGFEMGANSNLGDFSFVGAAGGVIIGSNVLGGQRVSFHSENHRYERIEVPMKEQGVTSQGIRVEDDCWLGSGAILLDGVTIGRGSIVAAGSVVTHSVEPLSIVGGAPARLLRRRGSQEMTV